MNNTCTLKIESLIPSSSKHILSPKEIFKQKAEEYREYYKPECTSKKFEILQHNSYIDNLVDSYDEYEETTRYINTVLFAIENQISDKRDVYNVIYPLSSIILVVFLAKACGYQTAKEISSFYRDRNLELQLFVPNLPSPKNIISASTINNILNMISPEEMEAFISSLSQTIDIILTDLIKAGNQRKRDANLLETISFDGQEAVSSFKRGSGNRKKKAAYILTIFNSTLKKTLTYTTMSGKNQERVAFLEILPRLGTVNGYIFMADALNSTKEVSTGILNAGAHYLLSIKNNAGNKQLKEFVEDCFKYNPKQNLGVEVLSTTHIEKNHGRIDTFKIDILPGNVITSDIKCAHTQVNTIVRYTKNSQKIFKSGKTSKATESVRYLICSLPFNSETLNQIKYSILDYWSIEAHHGVLDNPDIFNQDAIQSCNKDYLSNIAGFNKYTFNLLTWKRTQLNLNTKKRITYKDVMHDYNNSSLLYLLEDMLYFYSKHFGEDKFLKNNHQSKSENKSDLNHL